MLMKSGVTVFVQVVCAITFSQTLGADQDEDGFQRSNYYTNDQGNNVGEIQNQDRNSAKRQDKKVEHFGNNHAKYHEPKRYNSNKDNHGADSPNMIHNSNGFQSYKVAEGRTNIEKRSQQRIGDPRAIAGQPCSGHFHIPSDRVQYHDEAIGGSGGQRPQPKNGAQRLVRKPFNDQGNSNWRWGFRRKQSKDHPYKETSSYSGGNQSPYKSKDSMNGRNAHCEAMVRNSHLSESSDSDGNAKQNLIQSEPKIVGIKTMPLEQHQRPYAPRQEISDDRMYGRAMAQPGIQQWDSRERTEGADYQLDTNMQKTDLQPKESRQWMQGGSRNAYNAPKYDLKDLPSPLRNPHLETQNDAVRAEHPSKTGYNQEINGPVEFQALNKPIENFKHGAGLLQQMPKFHPQFQTGEARNNYDARKNEQIQNSPKIEELQRFDQFQKGNRRYENELNGVVPTNDYLQQPANVKYDAQDVPGMSAASRVDAQNQEHSWDDRSEKFNAHRTKISNGVSIYNPGNAPSSAALGIHIQQQQQQQNQVGQPGKTRAEEIRYVVLTPAEFNPETLRKTLGEPEKPPGIPYCTLEEYKMESANLKAKSYDAHERDMHYNGKGSISELISRLKRNNHQTLRVSGRRPIKSRASGEGPEMPVHACTATPSTCKHSIGIVTNTEAIGEVTTLCWIETLTKPTMSSEDLGINTRITPSRFYDHLRGRFPVISQFDYTAGTSCSTPCKEPATTCQCKMKRNVHFFHKGKRTPDEILLSDMIRDLRNSSAYPKLADAKKILPNALEEEKIIEKYLTALMENQISRPKTQPKNTPFTAGPGWLEKLLQELAENKLKFKSEIEGKSLSERNKLHTLETATGPANVRLFSGNASPNTAK